MKWDGICWCGMMKEPYKAWHVSLEPFSPTTHNLTQIRFVPVLYKTQTFPISVVPFRIASIAYQIMPPTVRQNDFSVSIYVDLTSRLIIEACYLAYQSQCSVINYLEIIKRHAFSYFRRSVLITERDFTAGVLRLSAIDRKICKRQAIDKIKATGEEG